MPVAAVLTADLAAGGFEWHDQEQQVIAYGDARAVRQDATILADRLIAHYRKRAGASTGTPPASAGAEQGGNEIYRLEATGHVRIVTPTDEAVGDHAIYDIDQAVLVMTGGALRLTTPQQIVTARDSLEYWSDRKMAVARGAAVVVTADGKRVSADTLVADVAFDDGFTARFEASRVAPERKRTMKLVFATGEIEIDFMTRAFSNTTGFALLEDFVQTPAGRDPLGASVGAFLDSVRGDRSRPAVTGQESAAALRLALAADLAAGVESVGSEV